MLEDAARESGDTGPVAVGSLFSQCEDEPDARDALDRIFRRERDELIRYLSRHAGNQMAADLAQEVFLRAATSRHITSLVNPRAFLRRVAQNVMIDRARRKKCRIVTLPLCAAADAPSAADQEYELEAGDLRVLVERALASLPVRTRSIFIMHRVEEKAYRDIHRELGISLATVEYHMMRALSHIRAELAEQREGL
jgi:RNA polymerase sigma factor (sigma-70 family)